MGNFNYKLINFFIVLLIILVFYETRFLWFNILDLCKPFLTAIMVSYILDFYLRKLNRHFNKYVSFLIFLLTFFLLFYVFAHFFSLIVVQIKDCAYGCIYFLRFLSLKYNFNIMDVYGRLKDFIDLIPSVSFFGGIFKYISFIIIVISVSAYLFFDFNRIICKIKLFSKENKFYDYLVVVNSDLEKYISGFFLLSICNILEYSLVFFIVGHPNYLFLGFLSGVFSVVPIFGGIITNIVSLIMAFLVNYRLFIRTIIGILFLSILDGYVISPIVYSKNNKIHPVLIIFSIFIGSKIFGLFGAIISLPLLVVLISTYKYLK